jgi:hypothetical protein
MEEREERSANSLFSSFRNGDSQIPPVDMVHMNHPRGRVVVVFVTIGVQHVSTHHAVIVVVVSRSIVHRIQCGPVWEVVLGGGQSPSNGRQQVFEFHE